MLDVRGLSNSLVRPPLRLGLYLALWLCSCAYAAPLIDYTVVARYAHPNQSFTEGFELHGDTVYESSGQYGRSYIARWQLKGSQIDSWQPLPTAMFGEGLTVLGERIYVLTWRERKALIFDKDSLQQIGQFDFAGEGWGLTNDGHHLITSNGSDTLRFIDPITQKIISEIEVTDAGKSVTQLNELEWIPAHDKQPARILANIWQTDTIVAIDPRSGAVTAKLDMRKLYPSGQRSPSADVLNGIAFDARDNTLLLTGKIWPFVYRVKLAEPLR